MSVQTLSRHRAAHRPSTSLSAFGPGGRVRRAALVGAASGLVLTLGAPAAMAAPETSVPVDVEALTQQARAALDVQPAVVVPEDAQWSIAATEVTGTKPTPPPAPVVRATTTASRSAARTAPAAAAATAVPASVSGNAVLAIAYRYIGVPYVAGGSSPAGFDCSGFTQYVYAQLGISIPRSSAAQRYAGTVVSADQAQPGDLIWWPGHVGIYTGNGQHIAARQPGTPLKVSPLYRSGGIFIRVTG